MEDNKGIKNEVDLTQFPEGAQEITKYMDWIENEDDRMAALLMFTGVALTL